LQNIGFYQEGAILNMDETKNVNDMSTSGSETEQRENYGQPYFAYFQNSRCEYFPCHKLPENGFFNCLFCYCPLYALGDKCGGNFKFIAGGVKDCSACGLPHSEAGYAYITRKYPEIMEIAKQNSNANEE
jgi:hypothetical protein